MNTSYFGICRLIGQGPARGGAQGCFASWLSPFPGPAPQGRGLGPRWPLMNAAYSCGFMVLELKAAQLKAAALPTDAKLPDEPTETEEELCTLRCKKVSGHAELVQIAIFIQ
jgi:hypothetical protein